jgi:DNA-binding response OmpR family regulator
VNNRKTILLIEADELLRACLLGTLDKDGHNVISVKNTKEGFSFLETMNPPSLIVFDVAGPTPAEWAFLKKVRGSSKLSSVPIIVSSNSLDEKILDLSTGDLPGL